jgi:cysteinyl-tRNA synthetase
MRSLLRVFNTMSGKKERFSPLEPGKVSMFVCGPTVQSYIHMGHARTYVFYDVVARYLSHLGYQVTYLMNTTDQDERITQAAAESHQDPLALARHFSDAFLEDMASIRCSSVSKFEPVSDHVAVMIHQISALIDSGIAYATDGWVYFDTSKFPRFGRLSHQSRKELALHPLELSLRKRNLVDFALWRPEVLVEGRWKSPWGVGSPGWHVQDTAVTIPLLGSQYDLHGGAYELVYPHHEAEIALAESLTGKRPFVKYWVHTHHMNMSGRKMSKSVGNVLTVRDALARYSVNEIRLFLLGVHYRRDMDLSGMEATRRRLAKMRRSAEIISDGSDSGTGSIKPSALAGFEAAMNDDFDTTGAIAWIERTLAAGAKQKDVQKRRESLGAAVAGASVLGVDLLGSPQKA